MKNVLLASLSVAVIGLAGCAKDDGAASAPAADAAAPAKVTYAPPPAAPAAPDTSAAAEACVADGHTVIDASGVGFCQIASDGTGYTLETYLDFRG